MTNTFIGVREVNEETFRKFRARAIQEKMKLGIALTIAMQKYLNEKEQGQEKKGIKALMQLKPFDFGPENENLSSEIDKTLYGKENDHS